jgi:hypothetical protein
LIGCSILLSFIKEYSPTIERWINDLSTILLQKGMLNAIAEECRYLDYSKGLLT